MRAGRTSHRAPHRTHRAVSTLIVGKTCRALFGTQTFGFQNPPPPLPMSARAPSLHSAWATSVSIGKHFHWIFDKLPAFFVSEVFAVQRQHLDAGRDTLQPDHHGGALNPPVPVYSRTPTHPLPALTRGALEGE